MTDQQPDSRIEHIPGERPYRLVDIDLADRIVSYVLSITVVRVEDRPSPLEHRQIVTGVAAMIEERTSS